MNILYLIGNGFDLNLKMKTSYSDFYKHYNSLPSSSQLIVKLKKEINGNKKNWSDLELGLGKHTSNLRTTEEFDETFDDIRNELSTYLQDVENKFDYSAIDKSKLFTYLKAPQIVFPAAEKRTLIGYLKKWERETWNIDIVTFNYTKSMERLTGYSGEKNSIGKHGNQAVVLNRIEHVHGFSNERMVMGVNDVSQIANKLFHENQDVLEGLVKSDCNKAYKHTIDDQCKIVVSNAKLICLFGSSIGDTDNMWWELVGEQLKGECKLIMFDLGKTLDPNEGYKYNRAIRKKKKFFLDKTKLSDKEKEIASRNILIGINTKMFDFSEDK